MKIIWGIVIILVIVFLPLIPIVKERYEEIQAKEIMGVVPSTVSEVQGEDVAPKTQHVQ